MLIRIQKQKKAFVFSTINSRIKYLVLLKQQNKQQQQQQINNNQRNAVFSCNEKTQITLQTNIRHPFIHCVFKTQQAPERRPLSSILGPFPPRWG